MMTAMMLKKAELIALDQMAANVSLVVVNLATHFSLPQIRAARDECHQLTHDQLDMVVMGQLRSSCINDRVTLKSKASNTVSVRSMTLFHFGGHHICHTFFLFLHAMSIKRFKAIRAG